MGRRPTSKSDEIFVCPPPFTEISRCENVVFHWAGTLDCPSTRHYHRDAVDRRPIGNWYRTEKNRSQFSDTHHLGLDHVSGTKHSPISDDGVGVWGTLPTTHEGYGCVNLHAEMAGSEATKAAFRQGLWPWADHPHCYLVAVCFGFEPAVVCGEATCGCCHQAAPQQTVRRRGQKNSLHP